MQPLKKLLIKARRQVFSEMIGNNPSAFKGEGYDFLELREYQYGDDVRYIDWNITAKLQKPYVKVFKEERELNIVIASMLNGSVYFGSKRLKQELIAECAALISFSAIRNGDNFSAFTFADKAYSAQKPTKKLSGVSQCVEEILSFEPIGKVANYKLLSEHLYNRVRKKSLIIVLADFFELPSLKLLAKKHEVLAVIVRDRLEEHPPEFGMSILEDLETGEQVEGDFNRHSIKKYEAKVRAHDQALYRYFMKNRIRFMKAYTDESASVVLRRLFQKER